MRITPFKLSLCESHCYTLLKFLFKTVCCNKCYLLIASNCHAFGSALEFMMKTCCSCHWQNIYRWDTGARMFLLITELLSCATLSQRCAMCWGSPSGSSPQCSLKAQFSSCCPLFILHRHFSQQICIIGFQLAACFSEAHTLSRRKQETFSHGQEARICSVFSPGPPFLHFSIGLLSTCFLSDFDVG